MIPRALLLTLALSATSIACSSEPSRAPLVGGGGGNPTNVNVGGGDAAVPTTDAGETSDAFGDGGAVTATGVVRQPNDLLSEPIAASPAANVTIRAAKVGGGTADTQSQLAGDFTLPQVAAAVNAPTWLQLIEPGRTAPTTIVGVVLPGNAVLPLYRDTVVAASAGSLGIAADTTTRATVLVHVYDAQGVRLAGIKARTVGTERAYYDEGTLLSPTALQTGKAGTIVFINVPPATSNPFALTLERGTTAFQTTSLPIAAGAVTTLSVTIE